ncbi:MAG: hypothetical protein KC620_16485 [Myxococcales bacterium]|nr:hypothetical protein [Myxococcales bacterium]
MRFVFLVIFVSACTPDEPKGLMAGACLEDEHCPNGLTCVQAHLGVRGQCGCRDDVQCPLRTRCQIADGGLGVCECASDEDCGEMHCDLETSRCQCLSDAECAAMASPGCLCRDGLCVEDRAVGVLLCSLRPVSGDAAAPALDSGK